MSKAHDRTDTLCPDCGETYCSICNSACPAVCMEHKGHTDADTALLEACREALVHALRCRLTRCHACQDAWGVRARLNERLGKTK